MRGRRQARMQSPGFPRPSSGLSAPYFHVRFQGPQSAGQWTALSASPSAIAPTSTPTSMLTWPPYASKAVRPSILICPSMASVSSGFLAATILSLLASATYAQLSPAFYARTCPNLQTIVGSVMAQVVRQEPRMGASIVRLFFHDCFTKGCDASVLLDDTPTMIGEKNAAGNANSLRGYQVIDAIKSRVEAACRSTVSCADILALASRDAVTLVGAATSCFAA
ncbi:hypothetical protein BHE74_00033414 [Ensete ventricosum]|nr:hypothetical protein BHE74_00033414 [Ensete ventricosum]RZS22708.1 hypothetical protein BHM03_00055520 [Ensete ventricosum]